jgi:arylsulfatase A-like enzyme
MNNYDASIRHVDDRLRAFMAELELRGVLDSTVVAITSDHGESFDEYGIDHVGHAAFNLHQNLTRVPWIVVHPDSRHRGRIREPVGLIDFPSTMLALLGFDPGILGQGSDALDPKARAERAYVSWTGQVPQPGGRTLESWSLFADSDHLLSSADPAGPERNALYDARRDPLETRALDDAARLAHASARLARRRAELEAERDAQPEPMAERRALPQTLLSELVALGYVIETVDDIPAAQAQLEQRRARLLLEHRKQRELGAEGSVTPRSPAPADEPAAPE